MDKDTSTRLLVAAGLLMLLAGCILAFTQQWLSAALLLSGTFNCLIAALNFKKRKDR